MTDKQLLIDCLKLAEATRGAEQRTARHARFGDAQREWRDRFGVSALALRHRARRAA